MSPWVDPTPCFFSAQGNETSGFSPPGPLLLQLKLTILILVHSLLWACEHFHFFLLNSTCIKKQQYNFFFILFPLGSLSVWSRRDGWVNSIYHIARNEAHVWASGRWISLHVPSHRLGSCSEPAAKLDCNGRPIDLEHHCLWPSDAKIVSQLYFVSVCNHDYFSLLLGTLLVAI